MALWAATHQRTRTLTLPLGYSPEANQSIGMFLYDFYAEGRFAKVMLVARWPFMNVM
jgi:hypothetical protein